MSTLIFAVVVEGLTGVSVGRAFQQKYRYSVTVTGQPRQARTMTSCPVFWCGDAANFVAQRAEDEGALIRSHTGATLGGNARPTTLIGSLENVECVPK